MGVSPLNNRIRPSKELLSPQTRIIWPKLNSVAKRFPYARISVDPRLLRDSLRLRQAINAFISFAEKTRKDQTVNNIRFYCGNPNLNEIVVKVTMVGKMFYDRILVSDKGDRIGRGYE